jgi:hypothetical protein
MGLQNQGGRSISVEAACVERFVSGRDSRHPAARGRRQPTMRTSAAGHKSRNAPHMLAVAARRTSSAPASAPVLIPVLIDLAAARTNTRGPARTANASIRPGRSRVTRVLRRRRQATATICAAVASACHAEERGDDCERSREGRLLARRGLGVELGIELRLGHVFGDGDRGLVDRGELHVRAAERERRALGQRAWLGGRDDVLRE